MGGFFAGGEGGLTTVLGTEGLGLTGKTSKSETKVDDNTKHLNEIKLAFANDLIANGGYASDYLKDINRYSVPSPETLRYVSEGSAYGIQPGLTTNEFYTRALQNLDPSFYINNASDYYQRVLQPSISNQFSLMGLGRSGAQTEANAKAVAGLSLPISQQYLQNLYGLNQQLPNVDIALRNAQLGRYQQAVNLADYPRQVQASGAEKSLQGILTGLTGTPYQPGSKTNSSGNQGIVDTYLGSGGGSSSAAGIAALASDIRIKDIHGPFIPDETLDNLEPVVFSYKKSPTEKIAGIIAQDLEKTEIGRNIIYEVGGDKVKTIDASRAISFLLATVASLHQRLKEIELLSLEVS